MAQRFKIHPGARVLIRDLQICGRAVLRRAGMTAPVGRAGDRSVTAEEYFRLLEALEAEANDPTLPIRVARAVTAESLDPSLFAALCSPDFNTAIQRIAAYEKLFSPLVVDVDVGGRSTAVTFSCLGRPVLPVVMGEIKVALVVALARKATRSRIVPLRVEFRGACRSPEVFADFFGVRVLTGDAFSLTLSAVDARRPFLTETEQRWEMYEPYLRLRLADLDDSADTSERVHTFLLDTLPSGNANVVEIARRLGMGQRSMQRRLRDEGATFQAIVRDTREKLARHYLANTNLAAEEISFLLGYNRPSSFYRAFQRWTGTTPKVFRAGV